MCVQIFDTWAGVLGPEQFERWCIEPTQKIVEGVRRQVPRAKIIGFPRGAGAMALPYVEMTGVSAIGIDWTFERSMRAMHCNHVSRCKAMSIHWRSWPAVQLSIVRSMTCCASRRRSADF